MKKIYALLLGVLTFGISASAADFSVMAVKSVPAVKNSKIESAVAKKVNSNNVLHAQKSTQNAPAVVDILGDYNWNYYSYLNSNVNGEFTDATITIDMTEKGDSLAISFQGWDVKGAYDAQTGVISIPSYQFIEYNAANGIDVFFYHNRWNDNGKGNNFLETPLEMTVSGDEIFVEELDNIVIGLANVGYFYFAGNNTITKKVPLDMYEGWEEIGTGTFYDGWIISGFGWSLAQVVENGWGVKDVVIDYHAEKGLYRLNNPYQVGGSVFDEEGLNIAEEPGYIVFDIANPNCVLIYPEIYSGYTNDQEMDFYNFNVEGLYAVVGGNPTSAIIENKDKIGIEELSTFDSKTGTVTINNCVFGDQSNPIAGYVWQTAEGISAPMVSQIVSEALIGAGVKEINSGNTNAPKEYFNLQGQRVANPEKGIFIVRQGGETKKVLVK